jgi:hypothetical protein
LRDGLTNAHQLKLGELFLTLFRLFEPLIKSRALAIGKLLKDRRYAFCFPFLSEELISFVPHTWRCLGEQTGFRKSTESCVHPPLLGIVGDGKDENRNFSLDTQESEKE